MGFLTNAGKQKLLAATPLKPVNIKYMAFSTDKVPPTVNDSSFNGEVYRALASPARKDNDNPKNLIIQGSIPGSVGGWVLFKVGLFSDDGVLLAVASLDDGTGNGQYKPVADGSLLATRFTFDFTIALGNETDFELIINDNSEFDHRNISHRDAPDSHPMTAITGLDAAITAIEQQFEDNETSAGLIDRQNVKITGNQDIAGVKKFTDSVIIDEITNSTDQTQVLLESVSAGGVVTIQSKQTGQSGFSASIAINGANGAIETTGQIQGDGSGLNNATEGDKGVMQIATQADVNAGTDDTKAITPKKLKSTLGATGPAPIFSCRAWANFDGANGAIRGSGNIASVVRTGVGNYTVTLTTPMQNANYAVTTSSTARSDAASLNVVSQTATGFVLRANYGGDNTPGSYDPTYANFAVFA